MSREDYLEIMKELEENEFFDKDEDVAAISLSTNSGGYFTLICC